MNRLPFPWVPGLLVGLLTFTAAACSQTNERVSGAAMDVSTTAADTGAAATMPPAPMPAADSTKAPAQGQRP